MAWQPSLNPCLLSQMVGFWADSEPFISRVPPSLIFERLRMLHCFDKVWDVVPESRDVLFLRLICSHMNSKPPRSAISPWLIPASWRKAKQRLSAHVRVGQKKSHGEKRDKAIPVHKSWRGVQLQPGHLSARFQFDRDDQSDYYRHLSTAWTSFPG